MSGKIALTCAVLLIPATILLRVSYDDSKLETAALALMTILGGTAIVSMLAYIWM